MGKIMDDCRTPHGVRGLKSTVACMPPVKSTSHPSRGAWIEIKFGYIGRPASFGRTPHGVRGLKCFGRTAAPLPPAVAPLTGCVD